MIERDELAQEINAVLVETFGVPVERITPSASIAEDLDLDSIDLFDLLALLEKRHGIRLGLADFKDAKTLADVVDRLYQSLEEPSELP